MMYQFLTLDDGTEISQKVSDPSIEDALYMIEK